MTQNFQLGRFKAKSQPKPGTTKCDFCGCHNATERTHLMFNGDHICEYCGVKLEDGRWWPRTKAVQVRVSDTQEVWRDENRANAVKDFYGDLWDKDIYVLCEATGKVCPKGEVVKLICTRENENGRMVEGQATVNKDWAERLFSEGNCTKNDNGNAVTYTLTATISCCETLYPIGEEDVPRTYSGAKRGPKNKMPGEYRKPVSAYVRECTWDKIREIAKSQGKSNGEVIDMCIEAFEE